MIAPRAEIDLPLVGTKAFIIPDVVVPLALGDSASEMTAEVRGAYRSRPDEGDHVTGVCDDATIGGGTRDSGAGVPAPCSSDDDCGGLACVDGACTATGGVCDTGARFGSDGVDECVSDSCCDAVDACPYGGTDFEGCNTCLSNGSGPRCDALMVCLGSCT